MKLTPLDIRKQDFTRAFRGYETTEVQAFLQTVAEQWQQLLEENRRQADRIRELEDKLTHYRRIEEALQQALETARENARQTLEQAERKARLLLEEAQARADEIRWRAEQERRQLQQRMAELAERRDELIARLRAFLQAEMEVLAKFEARTLASPPESERAAAASADQPDVMPVQQAERDEPMPSEASEIAGSGAESTTLEETSRAEAKESMVEREAPPMVPRFATFQEQPEPSVSPEPPAGPAASPEMPPERKGWTVRSIVGTPPPASQGADEPESDPSSEQANEEFEKIRRILKDLD
ncbi:MAG: DivIVA domain-containing protein [Rhodothermus sp.]|nr:DivIVA domain-containing protein [Rhodothermus sp.]